MKSRLYTSITFIAAMLALASCEPSYKYMKYSYISMDAQSVSVHEDAGELVLSVTAYPESGRPDTEVGFEMVDGEGDNGAKNGQDYSVISPVNGMLVFDGNETAEITIRISDANVGVYTGKKQFSVRLTMATNGYKRSGSYMTKVSIIDTDRNPAGNEMVGTYLALGDEIYINENNEYESEENSWDLKIYEDEEDQDLLWIDGIVPATENSYDTYGHRNYCVYAYLNDEGDQLIVPSQMLVGMSGTFYVAFTPCLSFEDGEVEFSSEWPTLTFNYYEATDTWESEYGMILLIMTSNQLAKDAIYGFFDAIAPPAVLTKIE